MVGKSNSLLSRQLALAVSVSAENTCIKYLKLTPRIALPQLFCLCLSLVMVVGCQSVPTASMPEPTTAMQEEDSNASIEAAEPLTVAQALPPTQLDIPAINLQIPVVPMGWETTTVEGKRTTRWVVPDDEAGWHVNSAGTGAQGNVIISGHQNDGAAVFAPLALGEIIVGQEILLSDEDENQYLYQVIEVTQPIPVRGATPDEQQLAQSYVLSNEEAKLTLVTGWPDFTTTHRVFAVAEFVGLAQE